MEGDHHHPQAAGDLTDIVRAGGGIGLVELPSTATEWHLSAEPGTLFPPPQPSSSDGAAGPSGDALAALPDPFGISDYRASSAGAAGFFDFEAPAGRGGGGGGALVDSGGGVVMPRGTTTQMPVLSPREIRPYPGIMGGDVVKLGMPTMMPGLAVGPPCAFDAVGGLQMPSPRGGGIKRRKNQARKVVCIPAPAALAGGRTTGEVVPSDLWAWRKYGQKPIKGSPYPRGYYRCSSSKGCPARKQVERSRTDPSMLVITYNSEHNHPWPTQRNALAGSTRSHHAKNNSNNSSASKNNSLQNLLKPMVKAEPDKIAAAAHTTTTTTTTTSTSNSTPSAMVVKEEEMISSEMEKGMQHATDHDTSVTLDPGDLMQQMFNQSYRPMIPEGGHYDDFFADLAELESDPMSLIFSKEYMETKPPAAGEHGKEMAAPKILADPLFNMLDWGATTAAVANSAGSSSLEQGESGL
ncbi:hypothetical protein QOZ80_2AG0141970 [Eleusine coracana subsp. coracana]|nr:hypothetical protein QOZ80_2AG0141970 [Eleusine coracana subsp. coracana]